jgi:2-polyprenyl-3-methyl-5-hydroxy-6-metoxy-1,4-benzoquinol methylase
MDSTTHTAPPTRPVLWLRARSRREVVAAHLAHVRGLFGAEGWRVHEGEHPPPLEQVPGPAAVAVMDDPWVEPLPETARRLAAAASPAAPAWRLPRVHGLPGQQGWQPQRGPYTLAEYRRRVTRTAAWAGVPPDGGAAALPWTGFAAAPAAEARRLLARGWPPPAEALVLVPGARLYRYADPAGHERRELDLFVPEEARIVVDVGCGHGRLGERLRRPGRWVIGVEPDPELAAAAARRLDWVLQGTAEAALPALGRAADCVIFADVLEHTLDPARVLELAAAGLAPEGRVVVSVPSSAWAPLLHGLAAGRWDRTLAGVQARDHRVPLTPASFADLAAEAGLAVEHRVPLAAPLPWRLRLWAWLAARSAGGDPRELAAPQWIFVLRRASETGP